MVTYNNSYTQKTYDILIPLIGNYMAQGVLKSQTTKLGITEDGITEKDLPLLANEIKKGLVTFIGSEKATQVASKIAAIV